MKPTIIADGKRAVTVTIIEGLGRVDAVVDEVSVDAENVANPTFPWGGSTEERLSKWGRYILKQFRKCDVCGAEAYAPPLASYDVKEFPDLKEKTVCRSCRGKRYSELMSGLLREEKSKIMSNFPNKGPIKVVGLNLCSLPSCNCGWNITLEAETAKAAAGSKLPVKELNVIRLNSRKIQIGGSADQWLQLAKICQMAGGRMPDGYPPRKEHDTD